MEERYAGHSNVLWRILDSRSTDSRQDWVVDRGIMKPGDVERRIEDIGKEFVGHFYDEYNGSLRYKDNAGSEIIEGRELLDDKNRVYVNFTASVQGMFGIRGLKIRNGLISGEFYTERDQNSMEGLRNYLFGKDENGVKMRDKIVVEARTNLKWGFDTKRLFSLMDDAGFVPLEGSGSYNSEGREVLTKWEKAEWGPGWMVRFP